VGSPESFHRRLAGSSRGKAGCFGCRGDKAHHHGLMRFWMVLISTNCSSCSTMAVISAWVHISALSQQVKGIAFAIKREDRKMEDVHIGRDGVWCTLPPTATHGSQLENESRSVATLLTAADRMWTGGENTFISHLQTPPSSRRLPSLGRVLAATWQGFTSPWPSGNRPDQQVGNALRPKAPAPCMPTNFNKKVTAELPFASGKHGTTSQSAESQEAGLVWPTDRRC
jgi:hypothetical protein